MILVIVYKFLSIFKYFIDTKSEPYTLPSRKEYHYKFIKSTNYFHLTHFPDILKEIDMHHLLNIKMLIKFTAKLI